MQTARAGYAVKVIVEKGLGGHGKQMPGACDNCGGDIEEPLLISVGSVTEPEMIETLCSWGCVLEFSAGVVALAGDVDDIRPYISVKQL